MTQRETTLERWKSQSRLDTKRGDDSWKVDAMEVEVRLKRKKDSSGRRIEVEERLKWKEY